ncbi:MOSC domain-containing protein [Blastococcus sp. TML/M2B]|nr:MOSC domain-containing protein [Blastococcus sp. TML/M2B]MBN1093131.1 MOSC domain-containing protein [Blastococcus sp. TML/M2B]
MASAKHPRKWGALLGLSARFASEPEAGSPLPPVVLALPDGRELRSDDAGTDSALSELLGRPVRLTSEVPEGSRFEEQWPDIEGLAPAEFIEGTTHAYEGSEPVSAIGLGMMAPPGTFFDLAALHVLTRATLEQLTALGGGSDFDVLRYRPNVLIGGTDPGFAEDAWVGRSLGLGDSARAGVSMLTMRCVMTTLAQGDLPEDRGTLRTVARHHRREIPGLGTWACAGVYADVTGEGVVRSGDPVTLA